MMKIAKKDPRVNIPRTYSLFKLPEVRTVLFVYRHLSRDTLYLSRDLHFPVKYLKECNGDPKEALGGVY